MKISGKALIVITVLALFLVPLFGCEGTSGLQGSPGPQGEQGPPGP